MLDNHEIYNLTQLWSVNTLAWPMHGNPNVWYDESLNTAQVNYVAFGRV